MGFKTKKGDAPPTGRVRPSSNFERTMALASQIAAESVPDEHTVSANEQAPAVVNRGTLEAPMGATLNATESDTVAEPAAPEHEPASAPAQSDAAAVPSGASGTPGVQDGEHVAPAEAQRADETPASRATGGARLSTMAI